MQVMYKDSGLWKTIELPKDCPLCGQIVEKNQYKTEDKHPDYKCTNREKGLDGKYECGCGFWVAKEKKPAHQIKQTPSTANQEVLLQQIRDALVELVSLNERILNSYNATN